MTGSDVTAKYSTWSVAEHSCQIEYSAAVLDELRQTAVEGYHRVPHGGVETGGILFGTQENGAVRIEAWRPVHCEYSKGPSFLLSESDEAALTATLKSWGRDPRLSKMEPVGWYRAHTRSEILLSDSDLGFFDRFFPQPWQVALIVRPASFAPTRAGFFFREPDGSIHAQSSYCEFDLKPWLTARPVADEEILPSPVILAPAVAAPREASPPLEDEPRPVAAWEPPVVEPEPPAPELPRALGAQGRWYGASVILLWVAAVVLLAAAGLGYWYLTSSRGLSLSATEMSGELRIAWDREARPIRRATGGLLEIEDRGVSTEVKLTSTDLRSGSVSYARQSGDVRVRLMIYVPGSSPVAEMTRFLRPGEGSAAPLPAPEAAKKPESPSPPVTKQAHVEAPPKLAPPITTPATFNPAPAAPVRHPKPFQAPHLTAKQTDTAMPTIAPPKIDAQPALPQAGALTSLLGPAVPPPVAPPRPKASAPVASGRIIWTGKLSKNGQLIVEGRHASTGAISAALPSEAARVTAFPGDLTATGITLFTSDARYSKPSTEAAAADNGWNATTYTWDPKRAAAIKVIEQPRAQNGYRLVLQSELPKLSVIVLQWRASP